MIMPHFTSDATKDDFDYLRKRSGMSLNCLDRLYSLGRACADAQRELVVTEKNLCGAMDALHKSERALAAYKHDAERYRWLRHGDNDGIALGVTKYGEPWLMRNEKLDAAIDAAMRKSANA